MSRCSLVVWFTAVFVWSVGCTSEQKGVAPTAQVKGTIQLDSKPIPSGELHFAIPGYPPRAVAITNGTFSGEAPIGKNQVELFIYVEEPPSKKYGGAVTKRNTAPEKYWGPQTALQAAVTAGDANEFKFDLTSR